MTIEAYRLGILIYASRRGYDYYQARGVLRTNFAVLLQTDTTRCSLVLDEVQTPGGIERTAIQTLEFRAPEPVLIDDQSFLVDRIVVRAPIATSSVRCIDAQLRVTGGGGGGGSAGMAIDEAGTQRPRKGPKSNHRPLTLNGLGNVVFGPELADLASGVMQDLTLPNDGSGNQAMISLNGLPPGEPILRRGYSMVELPMDPAGLSLPVGSFVRTRIGVIKDGTGKTPKATDTVKTHYRGTLINGTEFDSSYKRGEPAEFPVNGVIKGWTEALQLMKEGGKTRFFIPSDLAYGERGAGGAIPPNAALIFEVDLIAVK